MLYLQDPQLLIYCCSEILVDEIFRRAHKAAGINAYEIKKMPSFIHHFIKTMRFNDP